MLFRSYNVRSVAELRTKNKVYYQRKLLYNHSGDNGSKDPPVPIPNTEVKLTRAESTCRETDREDRSLPDFK